MELLSPKELSLLKLVCNDKNNIEIAEKLDCTLRYAEKIKASLYQKTKTRSNVGLLKWAVRNGFYKIRGAKA